MARSRPRFPRRHTVRGLVLASIAIVGTIVLVPLVALDGRASGPTLLATETDVTGGDTSVSDSATRKHRKQLEGLRPSARQWATGFSTHSVPLEDFGPAGPRGAPD